MKSPEIKDKVFMDHKGVVKAYDVMKTMENVILDQNEMLFQVLNVNEKVFYDNLPSKTNKDIFLHMSKEDRLALMNAQINNMSEEEKKLRWEYSSTLALHYINTSFGYSKQIEKISKLRKIIFYFFVASFFASLFTATVIKNINIQSHISKPSTPGTEVEAQSFTINGKFDGVIERTNLMSPGDFLSSVKSNLQGCKPLESLSDSFYHADGQARCKADLMGNVWIAGYVEITDTYASQSVPVLLQYKNGGFTNIDLNNGYKNQFNELNSVSLQSVSNEIKNTNNKKGAMNESN